MIDPNFNPYDVMEQIQAQLKQCSKNIIQLATALNARGEMQQQMVDQLNIQTEAINHHDGFINELHNRLTLLEMVRQNENNTKDHLN